LADKKLGAAKLKGRAADGHFGLSGNVIKRDAAVTQQTIRTSATLKKAGGSLVMTVPAPVRRALSLVDGSELAVSVEGTKVILEPVAAKRPMRVRRPKYTLDELTSGMDPDAPLSAEELGWMDAPPAGREAW
jgi:antitoxin ChpS